MTWRSEATMRKGESGADDIMKVTGHASPKMLKKYIKADYEYFR